MRVIPTSKTVAKPLDSKLRSALLILCWCLISFCSFREITLAADSGDTIGTASSVRRFLQTLGDNGFGTGDVDIYTFQGLAGQLLTVDINSATFGTALDSIVRVFDQNGIQLDFDDDGFDPVNGPSVDPYLLFTLPATATYYIGVSSWPNFNYNPFVASSGNGDSSGTYIMRVELSSPATPELNDTVTTAGVVVLNDNVPVMTSGQIGDNAFGANDVDIYTFQGLAGRRLTIDINAQTVGSFLDSVVRVFDQDGNQLALNDDDADPINGLDSFLQFTLPTTGTYYIGVSSYPNLGYNLFAAGSGTGGSMGIYNLRLEVTPSVDLSITQTDNPDPFDGFDSGSNIVYTITIHNNSVVTATNVVANDNLPQDLPNALAFVGANSSQGTCTFILNINSVQCELGNLAGGASAQVQVTASIRDLSASTITNHVSVFSDQLDPDNTNNFDTELTTVIRLSPVFYDFCANFQTGSCTVAEKVKPGASLTKSFTVGVTAGDNGLNCSASTFSPFTIVSGGSINVEPNQSYEDNLFVKFQPSAGTLPDPFSPFSPDTDYQENLIFNCGTNQIVRTARAVVDLTPPASVTLNVGSSSISSVNLSWTAPGDDGTALNTRVSNYDIRYLASPITNANWASAAQATGTFSPTTFATAGNAQTFQVTGLTCSTTYFFAMKSSDGANISGISNSPSKATSACTGNYSLSNGGSITVAQGASGSNTITRTLTLAPTFAVTLNVSGLPVGATADFTNNPCNSTCSSTLTIFTSAFTPTGTHEITVTGSPLNRTTVFNLIVNPGDTTGPSLLISSHTNNQTVASSPIVLSGTASDAGTGNNGISSVRINSVFTSGGSAGGANTASWNQTIVLNPGTNIVSVEARDASPSQNLTQQQITINYQLPAGAITVICPEDSLQAAVDAATPGQTILVFGICNESILVRNEKQRLSIIGNGGTFIIGNIPNVPVFNVRGKGILIQGFAISGIVGASHGIQVNRGANAVLNSNLISNAQASGITVDQMSFAVITNNQITFNTQGVGIWVNDLSTARIGFNSDSETSTSNNLIQNNGVGIIVSNGSSARIVGNIISNNSGDGIDVLRDSHADIASNVIASNGGDGIEIGENATAQLGEDSGSGIFSSSNTTTAANTGFGVKCLRGGIADGKLGSLGGTAGTKSFAANCIDSLIP